MNVYLLYNDVPGPGASPVFLPYSDETKSGIPEDTHYLLDALTSLGHTAFYCNPCDNLTFLISHLSENKPDFILNLIEYFGGSQKKEMNIAALYEILDIPYTGAGSVTLANCNNKILTKYLLKNSGVSTPEFTAVYSRDDLSRIEPVFPLIAKPAFDDGSGGIDNNSVVFNAADLESRTVFLLDDYKQPVLVEHFIKGREFNVAMIEINGVPQCLPVSEIDFSTMPDHLHHIVSFQAKWDPGHEAFYKTVPVCPAPIPDELRDKLYKEAVTAWQVMGMRGYARVDFRVNSDNEVFVLEINPNPDISEDAGFLRATNAAGYSFTEVLKLLIQAGIQKKG